MKQKNAKFKEMKDVLVDLERNINTVADQYRLNKKKYSYKWLSNLDS